MKVVISVLGAVILFFTGACRSTPLESTAATLNRDLDLEKSLYQFRIAEDEQRLERVLRKMPVGQTAADATLRLDVERTMASKLKSQPNVTQIRVFETRPDLRREAWVVNHNDQLMAFDVVFRAARGSVDFTVEGPMEIEGFLGEKGTDK